MKKFYTICALLFAAFFLFVGGKIYYDVRTQDHSETQSRKWSESNYQTDRRTFPVKKFTKINLNSYRPDIKIVAGEKWKVTINGSHGADISKIKVSVKNSQLTVSDEPEHHYTDGDYKVEITVPDKNAIAEITGSCDAGDFILENLTVSKIDVKPNYGDAIFNNITVKSLNLAMNDGDFKATNSVLSNASLTLNEGDVEATDSQFKLKTALNDGDVSIKNSKILGNSSFHLNDGDFLMMNAPKINYDLSTDPDEEIRFGRSNHIGHFAKSISGKPLLKVICTDGDISIL